MFLEIEEISELQAAKYITHNGAIRKLRILAQLSVIDRALTAPPASPASGDAYIVPAGATGAWAGWAGKVAFWSDFGWPPPFSGERMAGLRAKLERGLAVQRRGLGSPRIDRQRP